MALWMSHMKYQMITDERLVDDPQGVAVFGVKFDRSMH